MSQLLKQKTKEVAAGPDGQLLLPLNREEKWKAIPEPNRSECVDILRRMLQSAIGDDRTIEKGDQ